MSLVPQSVLARLADKERPVGLAARACSDRRAVIVHLVTVRHRKGSAMNGWLFTRNTI